MLDITDCDIADLSDADLRALVALLVEATLRSRGLSSSAVTWGGDQNAPDGGLDIRVSLPSHTITEGFIPRPETGYQIKKPDMGPAALRREMRPGGQLRESIGWLANRGGAYIVASSGGNLSDSAHARRIAAIRSAIADHPAASRLTIDYFDRQRLATWVRDHPAWEPWIRKRVGRPAQGWRSYGDWGLADNGSPEKFITDDTARLYPSSGRSGPLGTALSILDGLQQMRAVLERPASSLRLIGLSGVGKTCLVQALFDERVGTKPLNPNTAIYADLAHQPEPIPVELVTQLLNRQARAVVIVDNCPAELHGQLTQLCRTPNSSVSVVTVEYDVRDDIPEGTEVFRLEPASGEVVAKIVAARCPWLSQVDTQRIGVFSGGNARVGLALAHTTRDGDSLSGLSDDDLFSRLFRQRHDEDAGLLASAEACALVYSFDGETTASDQSEIVRLASLAGCTPPTLHRHIAELSRRGLVQARGRWRAVLPHAIANRLASRALENIPATRLQQELFDGAPERLAKSYSRRLSYLHDSRVAVAIAESWLSVTGLIGSHIGKLSSFGMTLLTNMAPIAPDHVLTAIERVQHGEKSEEFFSVGSIHRTEFIHLIRKIAYDAELFDRCAALLIKFALKTNLLAQNPEDQILGIWRSLFSPFLSGTHAPISERMNIVGCLLRSRDCKEQKLALGALASALEIFHFSSFYSFEFGSRSRDYGYHPRTITEQTAWFSAAIRVALDVGTSTASSAKDVRALLAEKLPGLWVRTNTQDILEAAVEALSGGSFWEDGWVAVKEAIYRSRELPVSENYGRLQALERKLATDLPVLKQALPDLVRRGTGRQWHFARGLCHAAPNVPQMWSSLVEAAQSVGPEEGNSNLLSGYLYAWQGLDRSAARQAVDATISDRVLVHWVPSLESVIGLDESSAERLARALDAGAPAWAFRALSFGRVTDAMPHPDLARLLSSLAAAPDGWEVAVDILAMRFSSDSEDRRNLEALFRVGRTLLLGLGPVDKPDPETEATEQDKAEKTGGCLVIAGGDASLLLEMTDETLDA